jgi:uncharacterized protein
MIEFSVGNYRSFKDVVTFSMVAAPIGHEDEEIDRNNVFEIPQNISLLKSAAIYGANASGKSNLVRAIFFMRSFVINSAVGRRVQDPIDTDIYRLSKDTETEPSYFEIIFASGTTRYRYGFEVDRHNVKSEWLYHNLGAEEDELFSRDGQDINVSEKFLEGQELTKRTRSDALFLSVVAQFNGDVATHLTYLFRRLHIISNVNDEFLWKGMSDHIMIEDHGSKKHLINLVKGLDFGIENIEFSQAPSNSGESSFKHRIQTTHYKYDSNDKQLSLEQFDLGEESDGTQKLYQLSGLLVNLLEDGGILIIDELDARLHPLITCEIVKLFNSPKTNPKNAQLIFTTHDTNLLSSNLFRKDQIWFTEKNRYGATDLYSLSEYRIPEQSSFEQDYIAGKYGAVPFIGDLNRLLGKK